MRTWARPRLIRLAGRSLLVLGLVAAATFGAFGYFDRDPINVYPAVGRARSIAAVNFSGDMGLRFLLGASTSRGLTRQGFNVVGISSPVLFRSHRTAA